MKRIKCWGGGRKDVGLMKLRSAGFEEVLKIDQVPSKIKYGYSKSMVSPPEQFSVKEIARSFRPPKAGLERKLVCGFRGDFICKNLYHIPGDDENPSGYVVYAVAAVVVVQTLGPSVSQGHFDMHDDDVTCLTVEKGGRVRRAAR